MTYSATAPVKLLSGTASAPSLTFAGGPGLFSPGPNQLAVTTGGVQRLLIGSDGSIASSGSLSGSSLSISGQSARTTALQETSLPIALDATAMPGASVLGNDGQVYTSIKIGESYEWSKAPSALSTGEIFLGVSEPRVNFNHAIASGGYSFAPAIQTEGAEASGASIGITRYVAGNGPSYLILAKVNNDNPLENTALVTSQDVGTILFMGADGTELIPGAAITATVSGTVGTRSVPMFLNFRTKPEGAVDGVPITGRMRVMPNGNVLINNTTGTERLSVAGNIQTTDAANGFMVGSNQVVGSRKTGWAAPTGTTTRTAFDTATATATDVAERVKALIDDLAAHGLIGA